MTVSSHAPIVTPCIKVCFIDPDSGLCLGCFRTGEEIANWIALTPERRAGLMAELPARRSLIDAKKLA